MASEGRCERDEMDGDYDGALAGGSPYKKELPRVVDSVVRTHESRGTVDHVCRFPLPSEGVVIHILNLLAEVLFPGFFGKKALDRANLGFHLGEVINDAYELLSAQIAKCLLHGKLGEGEGAVQRCQEAGQHHAYNLLEKMPHLAEALDLDVQAAYVGDPAATGHEEIIFCYPGFRAVLVYRIAHELHLQGVPLLPRIMTEYAHRLTGLDIHPGAQIGKKFFVDHGTGVVIGETTEIGDNVKIYQGVTLGALSFPTDDHGDLQRGFKRHPNIEDDVVIYSNASILGPVTIGKGSVVGGNVFLAHSVPPHSRVIEVPTHSVREGPSSAEEQL